MHFREQHPTNKVWALYGLATHVNSYFFGILLGMINAYNKSTSSLPKVIIINAYFEKKKTAITFTVNIKYTFSLSINQNFKQRVLFYQILNFM